MEFRHLSSLSALFCLALLGSHVHASLPAEDYWRSLWPNTPMPKALRDLTLPGSEWNGWNWGAKETPDGDHTQVLHYEVHKNWKAGKIDGNSASIKLYWPVHKNWKVGKIDGNSASIKLYIPVHKNAPTKIYGDSGPTELKDTVNVTFFFEHDLHPGKKLNVEFTKHMDELFLPDKVAKSIPFSSSKFPEILNQFSIEAKSTEAETVKYTLEICENPAINGEDKYCATSLESMLNFTVSKLGKNIRVLSTVLEEGIQKKQQYQQYSVVEGMQKAGDKAMVCHKLSYPYAVFYCHKDAARAYTVPLVATGDGAKAKGLVVCHTDTAHWNPEHVAFQQLRVKPGTVPICHFLDTDTLVWVPN